MAQGLCGQCRFWTFETNPSFQNDTEQEGYGVCEQVERSKSSLRALAKPSDPYAIWHTRSDFGCVMAEKK